MHEAHISRSTRRADARCRPLALALALLALALAPALPALAGPRPGARAAAAAESFANPAAITIGAAQKADPYPSPISVQGLAGAVADVEVTLHNFSHTFPEDVDVLLEGPQGQTTILMSDAGSSNPASGVTLTFDDQAGASLPQWGPLTSGTYRPTDHDEGVWGEPDVFPDASAPAGAPALSAFDGTDPNGTWRLYVVDDWSPHDPGEIRGGWSLAITPNEPPRAAADAYHVPEDRTLKRSADRGVLANDADPDGDALTATLVAGPAKGALTLNPDGSFTYKPRRNFSGTVAFTYEVADAAGNTATAKATIKVLSRPD